MNKALVLLSGGMKSAITLFIAKRYNPHVEALLVGCHYSPDKKRDCARALAKFAGVKLNEIVTSAQRPDCLEVENLPNLDRPRAQPTWSRLIPGSALYQLGQCVDLAVVSGAREVYTGAQGVFMNPLVSSASVAVVDPFVSMTEHQVVEMAKELDQGGEVDMSQVLAQTWSCERQPTERSSPCALCRGCIVRALGFTAAGLPDPLVCSAQVENCYPKEWLNSGLHPVIHTMMQEQQSVSSE